MVAMVTGQVICSRADWVASVLRRSMLGPGLAGFSMP